MLRRPDARALPFLVAPLLAGCFPSEPDVSGTNPWTASFAANADAAVHMAVDPSGAVALGGGFRRELDLGGRKLQGDSGSLDVFMGMLDAGGHHLWSRATGSDGEQRANGVAFDPDGNVVLAGRFHNTVDFGTGNLTALSIDIFVAKLGRDGKALWAKRFPAGDAGSSTSDGFAVDADGNIALGGAFTGTLGFGGPPLVAPSWNITSYVAKLDRDGHHVFSTAFGGVGQNMVTAVAFDAGGNLLVAGTNRGTLTIGSGKFTSVSTRGFVAKLSPEGAPVWAFQLGGQRSSVAALAVDAGGNALIGGSYQGSLLAGSLQAQPFPSSPSADGFVLQVTPDGKPQWLKALPSTQVIAVVAPDAGGALVTGAYLGEPDFGGGTLPALNPPGAFATRLDARGAHVRTLTFGHPQDASAGTGIGVAGGDAVVAGTFGGRINLGSARIDAMGTADLFAARLAL